MKKMAIMMIVVGLLMVGTARADEAWVLWDIAYSSTHRDASFPWDIVGAYPSYAACVEEETLICISMQTIAREAKCWDQAKCSQTWGGHILAFSKGKKGFAGYENFFKQWKCLPVSIDPRK